MEDVRRIILRWALTNAAEHERKASSRAVLGKILAELPEWKPRIAELSIIVDQVVEEVNNMDQKEQRSQIKMVGLMEKPKAEKRRGLPELPNISKYPTVVTRFAPNPNGALHIGHMRAALLSHEYARRYKGKFILRFEDTNPENAMLDMYQLIKHDLRWLGLTWDEEHTQSDRNKIYYERAEHLIKEGRAYVCNCAVERFRELRDVGKHCPCRDLLAEEQLVRWRHMLTGGFREGEVVVRLKTDLKHPNPAVRDWPALRIVIKLHPRVGKKYTVWPLYNFSSAIDDHEMGITHIIRGKEHEVNEQRQRIMYDYLGWIYPTAVQYGRLALPNIILSKTHTMQVIRNGKITGHDDVKLATIAALRRRGFLPATLKQAMLDIGLTPVDASLSWKTLFSYNRKFLDSIANRYFFVTNPVKLLVRDAPELGQVHLRLNPSKPDSGKRVVPMAKENDALFFHLSRNDVSALKIGDTFRLKDLMNVELTKKDATLEAKFRGLELANVPKIQWVPSIGAVELEVIKPDMLERGLAEPSVAGLKVDDIIQLERYGFVRIDSVQPKLISVYGHR